METSNDDRRLIGFDGSQYIREAGHGYVLLQAMEGNRVKVDTEWLAVGKAYRAALLERFG